MLIGDTEITQLYLGDNDPSAAYIGDVQIYPSTPFSGFDMTSSIEFPKEGGSKQIRIKCHTTWEIGATVDWLTISQSYGEGNAYVTVTAEENEDGEERFGTITGQTLDEVYYDRCEVEQVYRIPYETMYFTIRSLADNNTITFRKPNTLTSTAATSMAYSTDRGATWSGFTVSGTIVETLSVTLNSGETAIWKGIANTWCSTDSSDSYGSKFSSTGDFEVEGNIMSILYGDNFVGQTVFVGRNTLAYLFQSCSKLIHAKNLVMPATTLTPYCYRTTFQHCNRLVDAPELPATTLPGNCYRSMFYNCSALTEAPSVIPATAYGSECFRTMFQNCRSLTKAPTIVKGNTFASSCFYGMFTNCSSLSAITCLNTETNSSYYNTWVQGVASSGTFTKAAGASWSTGNGGIPSNWTVQDYVE